MAISTDKQKIDRLLSRGVVESVVADSLRKKLESGARLRVKLGVDPTAPDIHLGNAIPIRKLREFQDLGHQVVFIIGDYTARVGDPSGKSKTRPMLSDKDIKKHAKTYLAQVGKILNVRKAEVVWNGKWFGKMKMEGILALLSRFTVARMIERDDFEKRLKEGTDIHMHELLYPMMQAYDSVMVRADVELGGTDQRFNILAGRELQKKMGLPQQDAMFLGPILPGTDGTMKMSKSLDNYVGITEAPGEMFGKIMSIPDAAMWQYFTLCTDVVDEEIARMRAECERGAMNPRDVKVLLGREIVVLYHGVKAADAAEIAFINQFRNKEMPEDIATLRTTSGARSLVDLLIEVGFASSKGDARRTIEQGGVKVDGKAVTDVATSVVVTSKETLIQKGKRHFVKIVGK